MNTEPKPKTCGQCRHYKETDFETKAGICGYPSPEVDIQRAIISENHNAAERCQCFSKPAPNHETFKSFYRSIDPAYFAGLNRQTACEIVWNAARKSIVLDEPTSTEDVYWYRCDQTDNEWQIAEYGEEGIQMQQAYVRMGVFTNAQWCKIEKPNV